MTAPTDPPDPCADHAPPWAAYLAGDLPGDQRDELDRHLLRCDRCWREVQLARAGQAAATAATETAPPHLYDRIAAALDYPSQPRRRRRVPAGRAGRANRRVWIPAAALVLAAACFLGGVGFAHTSRTVTGPGAAAGPSPTAPSTSPASAAPPSSDVLTAAVADYQRDRLPGTGVPPEPAPDLLDLDLHVMAAATGLLAGHVVTVYAYADPTTGQQLFVYLSPQQFHAIALPPGRTTGTTVVDDVTVYAAATAHPMLVLGSDPDLVLTVGTRLT